MMLHIAISYYCVKMDFLAELVVEQGDFKLSFVEFAIRLFVAIGMGAIIGLEREHAGKTEKALSFAGLRTFVFVSLLGFIGGLTYYLISPWTYIALLTGTGILTGISYWITASKGDIGATTEFTVLVAFVLGTLAFLGLIEVGLMITVVVVLLLSLKMRIRRAVGKITPEEWYDFIRFSVLALLVFPFLPDRQMGPYAAINPREIGWVILLTSGIGFFGYVLMKYLGARSGILLGGIIGGLISSTAVAWVYSKKSQEQPGVSLNCAIAILSASSIMFVRILIWVFIFDKVLFDAVFLQVMALFGLNLLIAGIYYYRLRTHKSEEQTIPGARPLNIQGALIFGLMYALILLGTQYAHAHFESRGILISASLAGLTDIDAITIAVSKLSGQHISHLFAFRVLLVAYMSNSAFKLAIGLWGGSADLRKYLLIGFGLMMIAGMIAFWLAA